LDPNLNFFEQLFESLTGWTRSQAALDHVVHTVLRILLIVTITIVCRKILYAITKRIRRRMAVGGLSEEEKRAATLISLMRTVSSVLLVFIAVTMILGELNISIGPLLASAGVLGLAVGFGAQNLVRDVVSGFFMLLENQFREGDVIETLGVSGRVERFGLRATVLRDQMGRVHYIPNGEIKVVSNLTQEWSQAQLDVTVAYQEDLDRVMSLLTTLCREMEADPILAPSILKSEVLGVERLTESGVVLRVMFRTLPLERWAVEREFRRRAVAMLLTAGIEIPPYPIRSTYLAPGEIPLSTLPPDAATPHPPKPHA
jgi:moderate conductance mechanosensitive channel